MARRSKRTIRPVKQRKKVGRTPSGVRLDLALKRLQQAVTKTTASADQVIAQADAIASVAVERAKDRLVRTLLDERLPHLLQAIPTSSDRDVALRVLMRWLRDQLDLEPLYEVGAVIEIPHGRLSSFD